MKKFPDELARILTDKHILKVGVNIRADGTRLMKDWGVKCTNLVELGALSIQVKDDLPDKRKIRSVDTLTRELMDQIAYAANDVFVAYEIAVKIKQLQKVRPSRVYHVPLTTIKTGGADIITVHGTLQACEDDPSQLMSMPSTPSTLPTSPSRSSVDAKSKPTFQSYPEVHIQE
ncbi:hypothetical protein BGX34_010923 [Mortierella sp. NVP85]|nr:hypothetical protein BGX34_010923 [Mortierella sp. NVP85]